MEGMDDVPPEISKLFAAKEARRRDLAAMTWPEKVEAIIKLQKAVVPLIRERNSRACIWQLQYKTEE